MKKLVLASNNLKKISELQVLLAPLGYEIVAQGALGILEAEEPHPTFIENALAKARHAARESGLPAIADDSGLCVDALHGLPGVLSARFAGEPKSDVRNNDKLLLSLLNEKNRAARFVCVIVWVQDEKDPQPLIAEGEWMGEILEAPRGNDGFGYDPLFFAPEEKKSAAELVAALKNKISHRGQAVQNLIEKVKAREPR